MDNTYEGNTTVELEGLNKTKWYFLGSVPGKQDSSSIIERNHFRSSSLSPPSSDPFFEDTPIDYHNTDRNSSHGQLSYDNGNGGAYNYFGISSMVRHSDSIGSAISLRSKRCEHNKSVALPQDQQHPH